jgi:hypothetical protein
MISMIFVAVDAVKRGVGVRAEVREVGSLACSVKRVPVR